MEKIQSSNMTKESRNFLMYYFLYKAQCDEGLPALTKKC